MKKIIIFIIAFITLIALLFIMDVFWKSPSYYKTEKHYDLKVPIMNMDDYMNGIVSEHRRPYIYTISKENKGKVIVLGVEHVKDAANPQFDSIRQYWDKYQPDVALVEGRMGFFFSWINDPIELYGESGLTSDLAKKNKADLFTWEPDRSDEIELLIKKHPAQKLAIFYSLRPFFGIPKTEREKNPEALLQDLIDERTDYKHLKHTITTWQEVDSIWKQDFPDIDWRTYPSGYGFPGYFNDIWNSSNLSRDEHMIQIILEQVNVGKTVFVTMGSSHAPRIENALRNAIDGLK